MVRSSEDFYTQVREKASQLNKDYIGDGIDLTEGLARELQAAANAVRDMIEDDFSHIVQNRKKVETTLANTILLLDRVTQRFGLTYEGGFNSHFELEEDPMLTDFENMEF